MSSVHTPANFDPANYEVIDYLDNQPPRALLGENDEAFKLLLEGWRFEMKQALGDDWRDKYHHCVHCGNGNVRWITAVLHIPTGERHVFGADCTARLGFKDQKQFRLAMIQRRASARAAAVKVARQHATYLEQNPDIAEALSHAADDVHAKNWFVQDIFNKLAKYGSISVAQKNAVLNAMQRDRERAAREAAQPEKGPAPSGRVDVAGVVISKKWQDAGRFGGSLKMVVELDNRSRVYVSVPSGVDGQDLNRGDRIEFCATFTPSDDDKSFAFGKRPILLAHIPATPAAPAEQEAAQ